MGQLWGEMGGYGVLWGRYGVTWLWGRGWLWGYGGGARGRGGGVKDSRGGATAVGAGLEATWAGLCHKWSSLVAGVGAWGTGRGQNKVGGAIGVGTALGRG